MKRDSADSYVDPELNDPTVDYRQLNGPVLLNGDDREREFPLLMAMDAPAAFQLRAADRGPRM